MTKPVFVDKHVLKATADALTDLAATLPVLLDAADGLEVGGEVAQLRAAPTWASETAADLRARIGLVERLERGDSSFTSFEASPVELRQLAGGSMPIDQQLRTLGAAERARSDDESGIPDWDGSGSFSDWTETVEARALARLPLLEAKGELIRRGIHTFDEYQSLRARREALGTAWLRRGIAALDAFYLGSRRTLVGPGTTLPWLEAQAVTSVRDDLDRPVAVTGTAGDGFDAVKDSGRNPGHSF